MNEQRTAAQEHCDWCGGELGNRSIYIRAVWRGEYLRVHPHCAEDVAAKNQRAEARFDDGRVEVIQP